MARAPPRCVCLLRRLRRSRRVCLLRRLRLLVGRPLTRRQTRRGTRADHRPLPGERPCQMTTAAWGLECQGGQGRHRYNARRISLEKLMEEKLMAATLMAAAPMAALCSLERWSWRCDATADWPSIVEACGRSARSASISAHALPIASRVSVRCALAHVCL